MTDPVVDLHPGGDRLLVLLHGHADDPADLVAHVARIDPGRRCTVAIPVGPVTLADGRPAWFADGGEDDAERLLRHLRSVLEVAGRATGLPPDRAVVLGFSQGAAAAMALVAAEGMPTVAAVIGIAAWLPTLDGVAWSPRPGPEVLLVHGTDDEVVPTPMGRSAARFLERSGLDVTWHELDGGHAVTDAALDAVSAWLRPRLDTTAP